MGSDITEFFDLEDTIVVVLIPYNGEQVSIVDIA